MEMIVKKSNENFALFCALFIKYLIEMVMMFENMLQTAQQHKEFASAVRNNMTS